MKIERRLMVLVGLGMLLIVAITIFALQDITATFSLTTRGVGDVVAGFQRIWTIEKNIDGISLAVHRFSETGSDKYRKAYQAARSRAREKLDIMMDRSEQAPGKMRALANLDADFHEVEKRSDRIFSATAMPARDRASRDALVKEIDALISEMGRDIEPYQEEYTAQMGDIVLQLRDNKIRANILFLLMLVGSGTFLLLFSIYLHRKVAAPLGELSKGTREISLGNLDYRIQLHGASDITLLAERFNEMALKVKHAYTELEQKLLDRTRELAALDAVALTLSQAGNLKDMLSKSLAQIFDSLAGLELRGGVFLCDPAGEKLGLVVHQGLTAEFVEREESIRMGECLCGKVAQTGEIIYADSTCEATVQPRSRGEKPHGHIIIPIKSRGIVLGVIFLYPSHDFTLKPSDLQMLDAIGVQLGMAVENFRFYAEVKESSEKFWDLFENSRDILFTTDAEGVLTAVNKESETFSGYSKVELVGKSVLDFLAPADVQRAKEMLARKETSNVPWTEFEIAKRDGSRALIEISARRIMKDREPGGFHVSARDVTERKHLRELLVKAERLGAIGQVGVAVRHEINNPLTTVIGNIELLIERYEDKDKELTARLETILNNALRIGEIVKRLQDIKQEKIVDYLKGVKMTDLK